MLEDRIEEGESILIGFVAAPPWAYAGNDGSPQGFVNGITIDVLKNMGYTNIEPVLTDWSSLIPSLKAGRVDIVTGGMYIVKARCENMDFSDPIGAFGDTFVVPKGNPKNLETYQDLIDHDLTMLRPLATIRSRMPGMQVFPEAISQRCRAQPKPWLPCVQAALTRYPSTCQKPRMRLIWMKASAYQIRRFSLAAINRWWVSVSALKTASFAKPSCLVI